jgi:hypothetical protein
VPQRDRICDRNPNRFPLNLAEKVDFSPLSEQGSTEKELAIA